MNKTDEELNLAEAMAKRYGVRMCDENGDAHGEELYCVGIDDIADIIREALAEPVKQEPVAWAYIDADGSFMDALDRQHGAYQTPLYAAPVSAKREWVDLTDDEIDLIEQQVYCRTTQKGRPLGVYAVELVRAVITAFKEKNK